NINLDDQKAFDWLMKGAQPSDTVKRMLSYRGVMLKKHLQIGVVKGAITKEQADSKLAEWIKSKESKIQTKVDTLAQARKDTAKARKQAETKEREKRAEPIRKTDIVTETPAPVVETQAEAEAPVAESPAAEAPAKEAPAT